jgi:hypothetical protein
LVDVWADTTTPHGRLMLTVLGGLAEFERELIRTHGLININAASSCSRWYPELDEAARGLRGRGYWPADRLRAFLRRMRGSGDPDLSRLSASPEARHEPDARPSRKLFRRTIWRGRAWPKSALGGRPRLSRGKRIVPETVRAFQKAVEKRLPPNHSQKDEATLLGLLAALKNEFGLTDRYRTEGWRAGRE